MVYTLNIRKIIEAVSLLQKNICVDNYMKLIKLTFFADRYHIRNYGYLFTLDAYYALKNGPIPSLTFDLLKRNNLELFTDLSEEEKCYINNTIETVGMYEVHIHEKGESNLSPSEKEALEFTIENFSKFSPFELADLTHDYPEWKRYEKLFIKEAFRGRENIHNLDFFENPSLDNSPAISKLLNGKDPYSEDQELLKVMREDYLELFPYDKN